MNRPPAPPRLQPQCPGLCVSYRLDGERLVCQTCGRFFGYVRDAKAMEHIKAAIQRYGHYDPETMHRDADGMAWACESRQLKAER